MPRRHHPPPLPCATKGPPGPRGEKLQMIMIQHLSDLSAALRRQPARQRVAVICGRDAATLEAAGRRYMTQAEAWYRFNRLVLRYSAARDRWIVVGEAPQAARAGAALTGDGTTLYWLGGELKPGVRTPEAWRIDLP